MHSPSLAKLNFDVWYGHLREIFIHSKWLFKKWRANTKRAPKQHWVSACRRQNRTQQLWLNKLPEDFFCPLSLTSYFLMVIIIFSMECAVHWLDVTKFLSPSLFFFIWLLKSLKFLIITLWPPMWEALITFNLNPFLNVKYFIHKASQICPKWFLHFVQNASYSIYSPSVRIRENCQKLLMRKKPQEEKKDWADIQ